MSYFSALLPQEKKKFWYIRKCTHVEQEAVDGKWMEKGTITTTTTTLPLNHSVLYAQIFQRKMYSVGKSPKMASQKLFSYWKIF